MSALDELSPEDREMEAALRSLAPASAEIDPVAAAFEGGRRSARRQLRLWQSAAITLLVVSTAAWLLPRGPDVRRLVEKEDMVPVTAAVEPDFVAVDAIDDMLPTTMGHRRALRRSSRELEALLDRHALLASQREGQFAKGPVLKAWDSELGTRLGEM